MSDMERMKEIKNRDIAFLYGTKLEYDWYFLLDTIKQQNEQIEELNQQIEDQDAVIWVKNQANEALKNRVKELEKALEFYADERTWTQPTQEVVMSESGPDQVEGPPIIIEDSGEVAKQALNK